VAAATTAQLRGYRAAPYLWAIGLPLAAFTGYARMAADRHYFTDVLTGALVGSAVAAAVPLLMHARRQLPAGLSASIAPPFLLVQYTR
jgi:membrane-associated phospholipid phosphatase